VNLTRLPALLTRKPGLQGEIIQEICTALERLGTSVGLLTLVGSFGDTMSDENALQDLKLWNKGGATDVIGVAVTVGVGRRRNSRADLVVDQLSILCSVT
jgi:hypothetical protein